jgi:hypothetical protein
MGASCPVASMLAGLDEGLAGLGEGPAGLCEGPTGQVMVRNGLVEQLPSTGSF